MAAALLPPIGLPLLALVLLLGRRWRAGAVALGLLVALSTQGVAGLLLAGLTPVAPSGEAPRAIVILSADASIDVDQGDLPPGALERLRVGAALQRRDDLPILITGGREVMAMAASLQDDFQVPVAWTDVASRNVWQSALASAGLLRSAGIASVFLVVDEPEQRLAARVFRRAGLAVTNVSMARPDPMRFDATSLLPLAGTWLDSAEAIRQWAGLACDALPPCEAWMRGAGPKPG